MSHFYDLVADRQYVPSCVASSSTTDRCNSVDSLMPFRPPRVYSVWFVTKIWYIRGIVTPNIPTKSDKGLVAVAIPLAHAVEASSFSADCAAKKDNEITLRIIRNRQFVDDAALRRWLFRMRRSGDAADRHRAVSLVALHLWSCPRPTGRPWSAVIYSRFTTPRAPLATAAAARVEPAADG